MQEVEVFIFSFNRGPFLKNCVDSALKNIPNSKVTVIDDNSTNQKTLKILDHLAQSVTVLKPKSSDKKRWGGFYNNINWVIQDLAVNDWVMFIEDDMQFVRPLFEKDHQGISKYFQLNPNSSCMGVEFFKEEHRAFDHLNVDIDQNANVYFLKEGARKYRGTLHYNNPAIFNIKKMREVGFVYGEDRAENRVMFEKTFSKMGIYHYPLLMYLPFAPATKNKNKTITRRLVEKWYRVGFYPYQEMSQEDLERFLNRDISNLPYTSDWLKTTVPSPGPPFEYADSMKRVNKWVRIVEKAEMFLRRK